MYRVFRRIYESCESVANILEKYESSNQEFLQQKDEVNAEQLRYMNKIMSSEEEVRNPRRDSGGRLRKNMYN